MLITNFSIIYLFQIKRFHLSELCLAISFLMILTAYSADAATTKSQGPKLLPAEIKSKLKLCDGPYYGKTMTYEALDAFEFKKFKIPKGSIVVFRTTKIQTKLNYETFTDAETTEFKAILSPSEVQFENYRFTPFIPIIIKNGIGFQYFSINSDTTVNGIKFPKGSIFWFYHNDFSNLNETVHFSLVKIGEGEVTVNGEVRKKGDYICYDEENKTIATKEKIQSCEWYKALVKKNLGFDHSDWYMKNLIKSVKDGAACFDPKYNKMFRSLEITTW